MTLRVVVAEDDILVREGIVALLRTQEQIDVVGTADSLSALHDTVQNHQPDVLVTDIRMPPNHEDEGVQAALELADTHPTIGVVILSQYDDPDYAVRLLKEGTSGRAYLLKERVSNVEQLAEAVLAVAAGGSMVDPKVVQRLVELKSDTKSPLDWLTNREIEVLSSIAEGKDNRSIGDSLAINVRSVEKHINSIFSKLGLSEADGVSKRVAAVLIYLDES